MIRYPCHRFAKAFDVDNNVPKCNIVTGNVVGELFDYVMWKVQPCGRSKKCSPEVMQGKGASTLSQYVRNHVPRVNDVVPATLSRKNIDRVRTLLFPPNKQRVEEFAEWQPMLSVVF